MKRLFLTFIFLCATTVCLAQKGYWDQEHRNSFRLNIGGITIEQGLKSPSIAYDSYGSYNPKGVYSLERVHLPSFGFGYARRFTKWFSLEAVVNWTGDSEKYYDLYSNKHLYTDFTSRWSVIPVARFHWLNTKYVSLYSAVGLGLSFARSKNAEGFQFETIKAVQVSPYLCFAGISVGGRLYGFGEICASTTGVFQAGIGYRF